MSAGEKYTQSNGKLKAGDEEEALGLEHRVLYGSNWKSLLGARGGKEEVSRLSESRIQAWLLSRLVRELWKAAVSRDSLFQDMRVTSQLYWYFDDVNTVPNQPWSPGFQDAYLKCFISVYLMPPTAHRCLYSGPGPWVLSPGVEQCRGWALGTLGGEEGFADSAPF